VTSGALPRLSIAKLEGLVIQSWACLTVRGRLQPVSDSLTIEKEVPLAPMTSLGLGGVARFFTRARTVEDLEESLQWAAEEQQPTLLLGGGSNLVVADQGFHGLVIRVDLKGMRFATREGDVIADVAAGESWDPFVGETVRRGLGGLECLSGIPGSIGATPIQNVGAYGQEVSQVIETVSALDIRTGERVEFSGQDCDFSYRMSRFKREPGNYWVTSARFRLQKEWTPHLRYGELSKALASRNPSLSDVRDTVISLRRAKGMVIDPLDPESRSAGSFFTNPILSHEKADRLVADAVRRGVVQEPAQVPRYPSSEGFSKMAAAWLIERSGVAKGMRHGGVGVSAKHTLALVNRGDGTSQELIELALMIRDRVRQTWGVSLEPEPVCVGFGQPPFSGSAST